MDPRDVQGIVAEVDGRCGAVAPLASAFDRSEIVEQGGDRAEVVIAQAFEDDARVRELRLLLDWHQVPTKGIEVDEVVDPVLGDVVLERERRLPSRKPVMGLGVVRRDCASDDGLEFLP